MSTENPFIILDGVRTHNLKNLDVRIPIGELTVVTGVSGSGKSSLVFDTLYSESYRRYVESLSSFARQYLKALPKPPVHYVANLPPSIAVKQGRTSSSSRSTVGTLTELNDLFRTIFGHLAEVICSNCNIPVVKDNPESMAKGLLAKHSGEKVYVLAPLDQWGKVKPADLKAQLLGQGFTRVLVTGPSGGIGRIDEVSPARLVGARLVLDRVEVSTQNFRRLAEAAEIAFRVGRGKAQFLVDGGEEIAGSTALDCSRCGAHYSEPSPALLSFNHPLGACDRCQGFGLMTEINWDKVFPDKSVSLSEESVAPWNFGDHGEICYGEAIRSAKKVGVDVKKPLSRFSEQEWAWLKNGEGKAFEGVVGYFAWLDEKKYKPHYRIHAARYRHYVECSSCHTARLKPAALACRIGGENIAQISHKMLKKLPQWLETIEDKSRERARQAGIKESHGLRGMAETLEEARARLNYLLKIGVGYLSLDRTSRTLSGGELQRINMARSLGSALTDTLYCLDEPTCGLHPRDSSNLLDIMKEMRDLGNTVVVVEHESLVISGADQVLEIGPLAGHEGGQIVYQGNPKKWVESQAIKWPASERQDFKKGFIKVVQASTHNLKDLTASFPVGALTAVCGVSGSGKTSLVQHTLYPLLLRAFGESSEGQKAEVSGKLAALEAVQRHAGVMLVSQSNLGRSTRSNIATYLGFFDDVRKALAATPQAAKLGLKPGAFSFNTPGGRCENCRGLGVVTEDLSFLGEMDVVCPVCNGRRFSEGVLSVTYRDKNLLDILKLTVTEARSFFLSSPSVVRTLDAVIKMGLGYLTLGQTTSSFSGGEAQRLKLTHLIKDQVGDKPSILIFDEPTIGLSDRDVLNFVKQLRFLTDRGHTLVLVEHHLGVLQCADWIVEVGPEAGDLGGELVYEGSPKGLGSVAKSLTAQFI